MPELPEVQTVVSDLNKKIKGDTITGFWSDWPKAIKNLTLEKFKKLIIGRKILGARRLGKNLFIDLSGGKTLYIHLKMTGHLLVKAQANFQFPISNFQSISNDKISNSKKHDYFADKVNSYIHHIWYLTDSKLRMKCESTKENSNGRVRSAQFACKTLEFSDVRKFAKIVLDDTEKIKNLKEIKALGVDAMSPEFTFKKFEEILGYPHPLPRRQAGSPLPKRARGIFNKPIGIVLMDQSLIAGIGNIYRSEILYDAGIDPRRLVIEIRDREIKELYKSIKKILKKAIKMRGTSDSDYRDTAGAPGNFHKILKVYKKAGQKCQRCDTIIKRITMAQRSVFYCSSCQK
ncbi:MAG: bifunctional DNA-formamidopyrimidine glycosylase/DNA-(apurinic or apyrimidinic site) lyase [Candidatus Moranbacteria bacterium]|nr:bifunctional DNA-formamidopyrimidine glycosylase/DNA-(apurinic or apyrimidinic site) lyase [Candidatus Moranbacteria bacterium]